MSLASDVAKLRQDFDNFLVSYGTANTVLLGVFQGMAANLQIIADSVKVEAAVKIAGIHEPPKEN